MKKTDILNVPIDEVTLNDALKQATEFLSPKSEVCRTIVTPNSEIVMVAQTDLELLNVLKESDLVVPDGIGLIYASKILKKGLVERVPGIDLMHRLLEYCNTENKSIYILGGKPGIAEIAAKNIQKIYSNIKVSGIRDGYFKDSQDQEVIGEINSSKSDILFVGLGAPRQEKWIHKYKNDLEVKIAMGVGGSIDVWAGTVKRAPIIFQRLGLEWFYRLIKEPWRYKRMLALPKFMIKVFREK